jgi:molecular chaperone GrpE
LHDRNLRLVAEMENLRRRTERDKSEFAKYAISEFARDMLTVADNLRRAIQAMPKETIAADPTVTSLIEGVEVTERELLKVLERFQVKRFDPLGEPFNPHLHEAMTKVDVPNVPADTVIQTIHAGYMIGDRVLRPAAVIVAKGGGPQEQPRQPDRAEMVEEPLPPGAMRVPETAVSSSAPTPPRQPAPGGPAGRPRPQGPDEQASWATDERVAQFRRAQRPAGPAGTPENPRPSGGSGGGAQPSQGRSSSTLHKPVIGTGGGGGSNQEW